MHGLFVRTPSVDVVLYTALVLHHHLDLYPLLAWTVGGWNVPRPRFFFCGLVGFFESNESKNKKSLEARLWKGSVAVLPRSPSLVGQCLY